MTLPAVLLLLTFIFAPLVYTIFLSVMHWNLVSPTKRFVGLQNYSRLQSTPGFVQSIITTAIYGAIFLVCVVPGGLMLARVVDKKLPGMRFFRSIIFMPYVIPLVASAIAWDWMFDSTHGVLNRLLAVIGVHGPQWLGGRWTAVAAIEIIFLWQNIGFYMLVFLSGIQGLDPTLNEAASVDGATARRIFRSIELPQLRPVILFTVVFAIVHSFQLFDQIYTTTHGGPGTSTLSFVYFIYNEGFRFFDIGRAAAASVVLLVILSVVTWGVFRVVREEEAH